MYSFGKKIIFWYFYERFTNFMCDFVHELRCEIMEMLWEGMVKFSYLLSIFEKLYAVSVT